MVRGPIVRLIPRDEVGKVLTWTLPFEKLANLIVWLDQNADYERGEGETLGEYNMMAAVSVPAEGGGDDDEEDAEGRAVIIADGDFVTDQVIRNPGNALVFGDVMQWLLGEEQIVADVSNEAPLLRQRGLTERIVIHPAPVFEGASFAVFSRASVDEAILDAFNRAVAELRADGTYDRIHARFLE